jgi:hypothetical protein
MLRAALAVSSLALSLSACSAPSASTPAAESASEPPGETPEASPPPRGKRAPCQSDQSCNDDPSVSALWGRCTELGVCECNEGFERSPITDLCRPRPSE